MLSSSNDPKLISFEDKTIEERFRVLLPNYCLFADGSESIASSEICSELGNDRPYFVKTSVGATDLTTGIDTLAWRNPIDTIELKNRFTQFKYILSQVDPSGNKTEILNTGTLLFSQNWIAI